MNEPQQYENQARLYLQQGNSRAALHYFEKALELTLDLHVNLLRLYVQQTKWKDVLSLLKQSTNSSDEPQLRHLGQILNNVGLLRSRLGNHEGAQNAYNFAAIIHCELLSPNHPEAAIALYNLGNFWQKQGDSKTAWEYFVDALSVWKKLLKREEFSGYIHYAASCLHALGDIMANEGEYDGARRNFEQALELRERSLGTTHPEVAETVASLGFLCELQGDNKAAQKHLERALGLHTLQLGKEHPAVKELQEALSRVKKNTKRSWGSIFSKN